jgi:hypothetical protein
MGINIEDVDNAIPDGLTLKSLFHSDRFHKHRCAAVLILDSVFWLVGAGFGHAPWTFQTETLPQFA